MSFVLALSVAALLVNALNFNTYWYIGIESESLVQEPWPYLPDLPSPNWDTSTKNILQNLFLFTTLLNNFVPLSLYVTMEVATRLLMTYINWDKNMYHAESDTPAIARSTTVTDLGQIKYIFSDKTGTLTQNVMNFKRCSVDGLMFGAPLVKHSPTNNEDNADNIPLDAFHPLSSLLMGAGISRDGQKPDETSTKPKYLTFNAEMFLRVMSICHTVVVERDLDESNAATSSSKRSTKWIKKLTGSKKKGSAGMPLSPISSYSVDDASSAASTIGGGGKSSDGAPSYQSYQAESPDEGALVSAASKLYDFQFLGRDSRGIRVRLSFFGIFIA